MNSTYLLSNVAKTKEIIIGVAQKVLSEYVIFSKEDWQTVVSKYYIEDAMVEPTLAITLADNWIQFNLRYIVDYKKRRLTKHTLQEQIQQAIMESDGLVLLASTTLEVIKVPPTSIKVTTSPDN
jgi:hypothetical protein